MIQGSFNYLSYTLKPSKHLTKEIKRVTEAIEAPQLKLQSNGTGVADLAVSGLVGCCRFSQGGGFFNEGTGTVCGCAW